MGATISVAIALGAACDRKPKPAPAPATSAPAAAPSRDPLESIRWDDAPIDWSRPLPAMPDGGVAEDGYVGSDECTPCHRDVATSYARHSMARTGLRPLSSLDAKWLAGIFDAGATQPVVHERSGFTYRAYREGTKYFVEEYALAKDGSRVESWVRPITLAYSAGSYGVAFYFRQGERVYQIPIDYYPQAKRWGIDPGASAGNPRFSKSLESFCISCHGDYPRRRPGTNDVFLDPLPGGVGCERCHGPGRKHASSLRADDIVNPAKLSPARRLDVCAQCHESDRSSLRADRGDFDYRPGQPFGDYRINFVDDPAETDRFILLAHPERMVRSACWRGSRGELGCTSCHDPHKSSFEQPASWWDSKCNACHHDRPCTESAEARAKQQGHCVPCHMRSGTPTSPPLVTITDHWIQRRPPPVRSGTGNPNRLVSWPDLVGEPVSGEDVAALQAVAYAGIGRRLEAHEDAARLVAKGLHVPRLYESIAGWYAGAGQPWNEARAFAGLLRLSPDDPGGLHGYAHAMAEAGPSRAPKAMHALDRLLAIDADDPAALETKATLLFRLGRVEEATPLFARAAQEGPMTGKSHVALAVLARKQGREAEWVAELEAARRIEPGDEWILDGLAAAYAKKPDADRAAEIDRARKHFRAAGWPARTPTTLWLPEAWR